MKLLNHHYEKKGYSSLKVGIGVDDGRVLMIKAGFSGSGINDVIYMGEVVNRAAHLAHEAGRWGRKTIYAGSFFYDNLNDHNKGLLSRMHTHELGTIYVGDVVRIDMDEWVESLM